MIKINLLAAERKVAKKAPGFSIQPGHTLTAACSLILVAAALLVAWRFWSLGRESARLDQEITSAQQETARLHSLIQQVQQLEQRRAQLQQRVALIDDLRRGQTAPVHIIDQISRALPDMTWLSNLTQDGYDVTIEGRCTTLTALSDFVSNLEATRFFRRPVEIVSSEVVTGQKGGPDLIEFTIKGSFQMAGIDRPVAPTRPGRKTPAKGGKVG